MTDFARIRHAISEIEKYDKALYWLSEYGTKLAGVERPVTVQVTLHFAGSCVGAPEATTVIESYAALNIQKAIDDATACCRNTIAMEREAIREALAIVAANNGGE